MDLFGDLPEPDSNNSKGDESLRSWVNYVDQGKASPTSEAQSKNVDKRKIEDDNASAHQLKCQKISYNSSGNFHIKGYAAGRIGERDEMQDAHVLIEDLYEYTAEVDEQTKEKVEERLGLPRISYFGVYDGHGGARASKYAAKHLHKYIGERLCNRSVQDVEKDMKRCLIETFKKVDEEFLKKATETKPAWKDGSTAVSVVVVNNTLYIAHVGDSKAVLCRYSDEARKCNAIPLTKDHMPTVYEERQRIQKAGGFVSDGRVMGQLEVSRSLGDGQYKAHGVTCLPDIKKCALTANDRYIIIACDGLWKVFTSAESIDFVNDILDNHALAKKGEEASEKGTCAEDEAFHTACQKLASAAVLKLSGDNVTVVLVRISH